MSDYPDQGPAPKSHDGGGGNELPAWMTSPKFVVTMILLAMIVLPFIEGRIKSVAAMFESDEIPQCYAGRPYKPGNRPMKISTDFYNSDRRSRILATNRLLGAIDGCPLALCTEQNHKDYRWQLGKYVMVRSRVTKKLDRKHGDHGLERAQDVFNSPADQEIIADLRARIKAGALDLKKMHKYRNRLRMLAFKERWDFVPCRG